MNKNIFLLSFLISEAFISFGQKVSSNLTFKKGQSFEITMNVKNTMSQQSLGQAIDLSTDGSIIHYYRVTSTNKENSSLHHDVKKIMFSVDAMGKKKNFASDNPDDMNSRLGKPIKDILNKSFDILIDPNGKVIKATPEKFDTTNIDSKLMIIANMLGELLGAVEPPQKGGQSFFEILSPNGATVGEAWSDFVNNESEKSTTTYKITSVNETTVLIDFSSTSIVKTKTELMGIETNMTLNNKTQGKIILDKRTGIVQQKTSTTDSNGNAEIMGTPIPITSKTSITINVKKGS